MMNRVDSAPAWRWAMNQPPPDSPAPTTMASIHVPWRAARATANGKWSRSRFASRRSPSARNLWSWVVAFTTLTSAGPGDSHSPLASGAHRDPLGGSLVRRRPDQPRRALRQHHPHALDGRRAECELGAPRHADGAGPAGLRALHARPAPRSDASAMAGPRPLRALLRARVDAPVLDAAPDRLRDLAGGPRELPPARLAVRGAPGVRPRPGHRDHHRAARAGHLDRGRDGAGRAHAGRALQQAG